MIRNVITGFLAACIVVTTNGQQQNASFIQQPKSASVCPWEDAVFTAVFTARNLSAYSFTWSIDVDSLVWTVYKSRNRTLDDIGMASFLDGQRWETNLTIPGTIYPIYRGSVIGFLFSTNNTDTRADDVYLTYRDRLSGTLDINSQASDNVTYLNWQLLPYLNHSHLRYSLEVIDVTTGTGQNKGCGDGRRFFTESSCNVSTASLTSGHDYDYVVSFVYCPADENESAIEQLLAPADLDVTFSSSQWLFTWTSAFMQSGGRELEGLLYDIRLSDKDNNTRTQEQVSGYSYRFSPEPCEVRDNFNFEVKLAGPYSSNKTAEILTPSLSGLGSPEPTVTWQPDNHRILVQYQSPARRHQVILSNGNDVLYNVSTEDRQLSFPLAKEPQTIVVRIVPENCPGMSEVSAWFATGTRYLPVEVSHTPGIYQERILAAIIGGSLLITGLLRLQ